MPRGRPRIYPPGAGQAEYSRAHRARVRAGTVAISPETRAQLDRLRGPDESDAAVIERLLREATATRS